MYMPEPTGGDFKPCPAGTHLAVCYRVIDLGTQETEYNGERKAARKIMLGWEIPAERMEDGRPFMISKRYTYSGHEKATLRKDLEAWRGAPFQDSDFGPGGFDIAKVIGVPCMLSIIHRESNGNTYANINSVSKLPKGMEAAALENPTAYLSLDQFDGQVFENLSDGLKDTIRKSPEYKRAIDGDHAAEDENGTHPDLDDDVPF